MSDLTINFAALVIVAFFTVLAYFRHVERMADKKVSLKKAEEREHFTKMESRKSDKGERLENDVLVDRLMKMLQIRDWEWTHKHDSCRAELVGVVQALLDSSGEGP